LKKGINSSDSPWAIPPSFIHASKEYRFVDLIFRNYLLDGEEGKKKRKTTPTSGDPERDAYRSLPVAREQESVACPL